MEIEPGRYRARCAGEDQLLFGRSDKEDGGEQMSIRFVLLGEEDAETDTFITFFGSLKTNESQDFCLSVMETCGWKGETATDPTGIADNVVELVIAREEYNGKTRTKVKYVNTPGGAVGVKNVMSDAEKSDFANRMQGRILDRRQKQAERGDNTPF
ncbi:MAG: hypothetical protein ACPG4T_18270 [Nannocystaceae bacterium]